MQFLNPEKIIQSLVVPDDTKVADFGCGSGAFIKALSKIIGPEGKIYAVDIQKTLLDKLQKDLLQQRVNNVDFICADLEKENNLKIPDEHVDFVFINSLLFQTENKKAVLKEALRISKNNAKIVIIDWKDSFSGIGPDKALVFSENDCLELVKSFPLELLKTLDAGNFHYGFLFVKK